MAIVAITTPYTARMLTTVCFLLAILGTLTTVLRFWIRRHHKIKYAVEDFLVVPALILQYAVVGVTLWGTFTRSLGYPAPPPNVPGPMGFIFSMSPEQERFMKIQVIINPLSAITTCLIKLSILFFYKRIFCTKQSTTRFEYLIKFSMVAITLWTIGHFFSSIFICGSAGVSTRWSPVANIVKNCPGSDNLGFGASIANFTSDVIILIMPIPQIWKLHMRTSQKLSVIAIFMVGGLATAASMARMINWLILWEGHWDFPDGEYIATITVTWTVVEGGVGLIAASLMTFSPLVRQVSAGKLVRSIRSALSSSSSLNKSERSRKTSEDESVNSGSTRKKIVVQTDIETGWETSQHGNLALPAEMAASYMPR